MAVKLFIVGLPGSGKSEVARNIETHVKNTFWPEIDGYWDTKRFNDYPILDDMSRDLVEGKLFERLEPKGFNVLNIVAFDIALQSLEQQIKDYISSAKKEVIILIEFARNDYWRAFGQFDKSFLQDAYFIHLDAKVEVCKQRVCDRVADPKNPDDDFPVSDYIFQKYYYGDDVYALSSILHDVYGVDTQRVLMINNNGSLETALKEIESFVDSIIKFTESYYCEATPSSGSQDVSGSVGQQELATVKYPSEGNKRLTTAGHYQFAS